MTRRVGIIGFPLRHSLSPIFQQAAFDNMGLDFSYESWEIHPDALKEEIQRLISEGVVGLNVTIPHKESILAMLDHLTDFAASMGAVNTVVIEDGHTEGHNTDAYGFLRALNEDASFDPGGKNVLVIGAGGSARAVLMALSCQGPASITLANRTVDRAHALAKSMKRNIGQISVMPLEHDALAAVAMKSDLIINCTPMGMKHSPYTWQTPLTSDIISPDSLVFDLVYNPQETPLLGEARKASARTLGGLPMLIYQGAQSFTLWTGAEAPTDFMFWVAQKALDEDFD